MSKEDRINDAKLADRIMKFLHDQEGKWPGEGTCAECHGIGMQDAVRGLRLMKESTSDVKS